MSKEIEQIIKTIVTTILDLPIDALTHESSPENTENWDSLKHIKIISALEEEFLIEFSDEEILDMLIYGSMIEIVSQKS